MAEMDGNGCRRAALVLLPVVVALGGCVGSGSSAQARDEVAVAVEAPVEAETRPVPDVAGGAAFTTTVPVGPALGAGDGANEVEAVFDEYRSALTERDGERAVAVLSADTFAWYDEARAQALSAPEQVLLEEAPLLDAITILRLRSGVGEDLLRSLSGEELVALAVDAGWVGASVGSTDLDQVRAGEEGEVFGVIDGASLFRFVEEPDGWKVDLPYTADQTTELVGEDVFIQEISGGEATTRQELFTLLAAGLGTTWDEVSQPID